VTDRRYELVIAPIAKRHLAEQLPPPLDDRHSARRVTYACSIGSTTRASASRSAVQVLPADPARNPSCYLPFRREAQNAALRRAACA
jgi:hypothetical protein